jgi:hypothetical protein
MIIEENVQIGQSFFETWIAGKAEIVGLGF